MGIRFAMADALHEDEAAKKQFIRNVAPALFKLKPRGTTPVAQLDERAGLAGAIYHNVIVRFDGNYLTEEDVTLLGDLLCDIVPDDAPVSMELLYRLRDGTHIFGDPKRDVTPEVWLRFVRRLLASPRPLVHAYGRYAQLCDRRYRLNEASEELLAEAKSL